MRSKLLSFNVLTAGCILLGGAVLAYCAEPKRTPEVVVTATRFETPVGELAVNATVITAAEIARSAARTLPDLLRLRAGITTRDLFGNNSASSTVDMRGFGANANENTLILVDGRRYTDVDRSGVQWSSIPLEQIERVEVLRGSGAVQYGDGASAGVINIITRYVGRDAPRADASLRYGSWDTLAMSGSARAAVEDAGLSAFVHNYESHGYRDNNRNRQANFALVGTWSGAAADATVRLAADRQGIRLPGARQVQPSAGVDQLSTDRRGTSTPLDYAQRDGNQASLDLRWQFAAGEFILGLGYRDKAQRSLFDFSGFPDYRDIELDVYHVQPRYQLRGDTLGLRHTIILGLDLARWDYRLLRSNAASNVARPFNTVNARQENTAVYVLDTLKASERLSLSAGARREWQRLSATDRFDPAAPGGAFGSGAPAGANSPKAWAAEIGARLRVMPETALIARASRSFRFANVDEIYETSPAFAQQFQFLRPQRANTYEFGFERGRPQAWLKAAVFRMDVRDEIHLDPFSAGVGNRNMPPLRRNGLELEWRRELLQRLAISGTYTFVDAKFREGVLPGSAFTQQNVELAGRTVPLVPRHKVGLAVDFSVAKDTAARAEARYVSRQFMENDEANNFYTQIPAYTVVDFKLTQRIGKFKLSAAVDNLFDRKYMITYDNRPLLFNRKAGGGGAYF